MNTAKDSILCVDGQKTSKIKQKLFLFVRVFYAGVGQQVV